MTRYLRFFFAFTLLVLLAVQPVAAAYFYILISENNKVSAHRMMEIRSFPENLRCGIVQYWIGKNVPKNGAILVVGDSQPFGWKAKSSNIFSALLDGANHLVVKNGSIVDGHFDDAQNVLRIVANANIRLNAVILNVDPAHFKGEYKVPRNLPFFKCSALSLPGVLFEMDLLPFMKEIALIHAKTNPDYQAPWFFRDQDADLLPSETMSEPLAADYISDQNNIKYEQDFISVLEAAKTVSDKTIVYMSPMQLYKKLPNAQKKIRSRYMQLCEQFASSNSGVTCLDPNDLFEKKDFLDIVHLSKSGHRKMADILSPLIYRRE